VRRAASAAAPALATLSLSPTVGLIGAAGASASAAADESSKLCSDTDRAAGRSARESSPPAPRPPPSSSSPPPPPSPPHPSQSTHSSRIMCSTRRTVLPMESSERDEGGKEEGGKGVGAVDGAPSRPAAHPSAFGRDPDQLIGASVAAASRPAAADPRPTHHSSLTQGLGRLHDDPPLAHVVQHGATRDVAAARDEGAQHFRRAARARERAVDLAPPQAGRERGDVAWELIAEGGGVVAAAHGGGARE